MQLLSHLLADGRLTRGKSSRQLLPARERNELARAIIPLVRVTFIDIRKDDQERG